MVPINSSDTAWLIVSDYNQDNDFLYEDLREDVLNPDVDQWHTLIYYIAFDGVGSSDVNVGTTGYLEARVGIATAVGGVGPLNPSIYNAFGHLVGGNAPD